MLSCAAVTTAGTGGGRSAFASGNGVLMGTAHVVRTAWSVRERGWTALYDLILVRSGLKIPYWLVSVAEVYLASQAFGQCREESVCQLDLTSFNWNGGRRVYVFDLCVLINLLLKIFEDSGLNHTVGV